MWLFMTDAFLSMVADPGDPRRLLVRARKAGDIEALFPDAVIFEQHDADYRYSAPVARALVANVVAEQIGRIHYEDFTAALEPSMRRDAYLEIWWRLAGWQWEEAIGEPKCRREGEAVRP